MSAETLQKPGRLLTRLLDAQQIEEHVVGYPRLQAVADSVIWRARAIRDCLVWPVGAAAERVAGGVTMRSRGGVEVGSWNTDVRDRRLLVLVVAGVSPLSLESAAAQLRRRGAREVHGCGVAVDGAHALGTLDSYTQLEVASTELASFTVVGDAA